MDAPQKPRVPEFSDNQLALIMQLAKRESITVAYIESMDRRAATDFGRDALVSSLAYRANEILDFRAKVREAMEAKLKERVETPVKVAEPKTEPAGV